MRSLLSFSTLCCVVVLWASCKKCVQCDIDLKEGNFQVAQIAEYCDTREGIKNEEDRLISQEYTCVECVVNASFGPTSSGFHCGDRAFVDSLENDWRTGAMQSGLQHNCTFYRDTLEVRCTLIP